eukprot:scaffold168504_cov33-Tisochrysis_lutea.AAC.3
MVNAWSPEALFATADGGWVENGCFTCGWDGDGGPPGGVRAAARLLDVVLLTNCGSLQLLPKLISRSIALLVCLDLIARALHGQQSIRRRDD